MQSASHPTPAAVHWAVPGTRFSPTRRSDTCSKQGLQAWDTIKKKKKTSGKAPGSFEALST